MFLSLAGVEESPARVYNGGARAVTRGEKAEGRKQKAVRTAGSRHVEKQKAAREFISAAFCFLPSVLQ
jgi:hypothetical protein